MSISLELLQKLPLFSGLNEKTLSILAQHVFQKNYLTNEIIQMEGDPCTHVYFLLSGAARIYRSALNGREQVLSILTPGMHFNTVPALIPDGQKAQGLRASISALTPLELLLLPVDSYRNFLQTTPDLAYAILTDFARRLDHFTGLVEDLSLHSVRGRLARFLLDQADKGEMSERWTQDEIAAQLGTVRDVIGRTLRGFIDAGLVKREGARLVLVDRRKLEEETQF